MKKTPVVLAAAFLLSIGAVQCRTAAAQTTLEQLASDLKGGTADKKMEAAAAIGKLGPQAAGAVDALNAALLDADPKLRAEAARSLGKIGPAAKRATPELIKLFKDEDQGNESVPIWHIAAESVGQLGAESLPGLIKMISGDDLQLCRAAAVAIHGLGPEGKPAVSAIVEQLRLDKSETRIPMIYALLGIGPTASDGVPVLITMLSKEEDFHTQYLACRALGKVGLPGAKSAVPELIRLVKHPVASVRGNAAAALGNLGPGVAADVVPTLTSALGDKLYNVRRAAAISLGQMGPQAAASIPALDKVLGDENFAARSQAAVARWRITAQVEPTVKVLLEELQKPDAPWDAAEGFESVGAPAQVAVDRLTQMFASPMSETRLFAASSLAGIGAPAKPAIPKVKKLLTDPDEDVRAVAAEVIKKLEELKSVPPKS